MFNFGGISCEVGWLPLRHWQQCRNAALMAQYGRESVESMEQDYSSKMDSEETDSRKLDEPDSYGCFMIENNNKFQFHFFSKQEASQAAGSVFQVCQPTSLFCKCVIYSLLPETAFREGHARFEITEIFLFQRK